MKEENKALIYFLLHAVIVVIVFLALTNWLIGNPYGGGPLTRVVFQLMLYFFQLIFILIAHKGTPYIKYAFFGATLTFVMIFIYEATYTSGKY